MSARSQQERIIVADDHPVFRDGLCRIAQRVFPHAQILEAGDMDEVLALARGGAAPSLLMLDLLFPGQSPHAISALRQEFQRSSIVVVSMVDNRELIDEVEGLDRGWYAGPVGWMDGSGDGEFCVALRSALLRDREARLYAGVGIVADSDPANELAETEIKLDALLPLVTDQG